MKNLRLLALLLLLVSCQPRQTEIVILSLNDLHAKIDNMDKVAAYVAGERAQHPNVLLLSAGDIFSGNPVVDYYPDKGYPMVDIMNHLHFDASVPGNHEFDYGQPTLARRMEQANFPFVCANMHTDSSPIPPLQPYVLLTLSGEKIAVVGLIQERPETHVDKLKQLRFDNPVSAFEKYLPLRKSSNLLIALTHMGVLQDTLLASRYGAIDVVVGGHSHTKLDSGMLINGVLVTQAGRYVQYIGKTTVLLRNGRVVSKKNTLVDVAALEQRDTAITRKIGEYNSNPELAKVVGTLKKSIVGDFNIGNFFCDAVRAQAKVDVAFQNVHGVRVDSLRKGALTKKDLYLADPFGNEIIRFEMTGSEVVQFVTGVYNRFKELDLCVSGMTYQISVRNGQPSVRAFLPGGKPMDLRKTYSVAMNSYMATKAEDYSVPGSGSGLGVITVEATERYLVKHKVLNFTSPKRAELLVE